MNKYHYIIIAVCWVIVSSCHRETFVDYRIDVDSVSIIDYQFEGSRLPELQGMKHSVVYLCNSEEDLQQFSPEVREILHQNSINFYHQSALLVWNLVGEIKDTTIEVCYWPHKEQYGVIMVGKTTDWTKDYARLIIITMPKIYTNNYITFQIW